MLLWYDCDSGKPLKDGNIMVNAKLTNGTWTRYYDSIGSLCKELHNLNYSCAAKIFCDGKHKYYYMGNGSIAPAKWIQSLSDNDLMREFWPFDDVQKLRDLL